MPEKRITIRRGDKLTISINRKSSQKKLNRTTAGLAAAAGLIKTRRTDDYLPRRKRAGGIQFFDFGQIRNEDNSYSDWIVENLTAPEISGGDIITYDLTDDDWNMIRDGVLTIENFSQHSRLIEQLHTNLFPLAIIFGDPDAPGGFIDLATDTRFAANSLTFTADELATDTITLTVIQDFFFGDTPYLPEPLTIRLKDENGDFAALNKFTSSPDPDADAVSYSISTTDKIYLVPQFRLFYAYAVQYFEESEILYKQYFLNYFYRLMPRALYLDPKSGFYDYAKYVLYTADPGSSIDSRFTDDFLEIVEMQVADADARAYYREVPVSGTPTVSTLPVEDFPGESVITPANMERFETLRGGYEPVDAPPGFLLAIIVRGSQKFYVWKAT